MNSQTLKKLTFQRPRKTLFKKISWNPQPHVLLSSWSNLKTFRSIKNQFQPKSNSSASPAELCLWCAVPSFWGGSLVFEKNKNLKDSFLGVSEVGRGRSPAPPPPCSLHPPPPPKSPENLFEPEFWIGLLVSVSSLQWPEGTGSSLGLSLGGNRSYEKFKTSRSRGRS